MFSRFGLFIRNRRDEETGHVNEDEELPKHGENKPYPYILILKTLLYACIASAIVCKLIKFVVS